jgi:hypothetical protein
MSDKKITQLEALTSLEGADLFVVVDNVAENPENKKVAAADVVEFVSNSDVLAGVISAAVGDPIQLDVLEAKGDLLVAATDAVVSRLPVGVSDGHVLTVDSEEYLGVKWDAPIDATKIPLSVVDAKGDLIVASADNTVAKLSVGTNDHVLTADSNATNGVKWAAIPTPTIVWENDQNVLANAVFG